MGAGQFDAIENQEEVGSAWLVVSGPRGGKVTEAFKTEAEARHYVGVMTARGVEAEVRELVKLAYPIALSVDVERAGTADRALLCNLLAKALLRAIDGVLSGALAANAAGPAVTGDEAPGPKIVVPTLTVRRRPPS